MSGALLSECWIQFFTLLLKSLWLLLTLAVKGIKAAHAPAAALELAPCGA